MNNNTDTCGLCRQLLDKLANSGQRSNLVDAVIPHEGLQNVPEIREAARVYADALKAAARKVVTTQLCQEQFA